MKSLKVRLISPVFLLLMAILIGVFVANSCKNIDNGNSKLDQSVESKSEILERHNWKTTKVTDQDGKEVSSEEESKEDYLGYSYYKKNGDFRFTKLNDELQINGKWSINDNKMILTVYDEKNEKNDRKGGNSFHILELNDDIFAFIFVPDAKNPDKHYIVEQKPDDHKEPNTPAQTLASVTWKTTKVFDITQEVEGQEPSEVALDKVPLFISGEASYKNQFGGEYYPKIGDNYANGNFKITGSDNKSVEGTWYVTLSGKTCMLEITSPDEKKGKKEMKIVELSDKKFIYEIENVKVKEDEAEPQAEKICKLRVVKEPKK